jgi:hypothetical protein
MQSFVPFEPALGIGGVPSATARAVAAGAGIARCMELLPKRVAKVLLAPPTA